MSQLKLHEHYAYRMLFDNIQKINCPVLCNFEEQRDKIKLQAAERHWKEKRDEQYIAYCGDNHCCLVITTDKTIPASDATSNRNFKLNVVPTAEWLDLGSRTVHYLSSKVTSFASGFVPVAIWKRKMDTLRSQVLQLWGVDHKTFWWL